MTLPASRIRSLLEWRAALAVMCAFPAGAVAQSASISASVIDANHYLLSSRLAGAAARLSYPFHNGPVSIRIGAERLAANSHRIGAPCAGLVQPGTCQPEPVRDDAHFTAAIAGLGVRVLDSRRLAVNLTGDLSFVVLNVDSHGLTSGGSISAGKGMWDTNVGVEGAWSPWGQLPLAIEAGIAAGHVVPAATDLQLDGYTPFEQSFDIVRVRVGLSWQFPSR